MAVDVERVAQPVPAWQRGRVASWLVTTDHKRIGILYLATSGLFFVAGGIMALLIRTQLAQADAGFIERLDAPYRPLDDATWDVHSRFGESDAERTLARSAWLADELAFFRRFAELPVYDGTTPGSRCVWFFDLRFAAPGRNVLPFRYGVCRAAADARWRVHEIDGHGRLVRLIR